MKEALAHSNLTIQTRNKMKPAVTITSKALALLILLVSATVSRSDPASDLANSVEDDYKISAEAKAGDAKGTLLVGRRPYSEKGKGIDVIVKNPHANRIIKAEIKVTLRDTAPTTETITLYPRGVKKYSVYVLKKDVLAFEVLSAAFFGPVTPP